MRSGKRQQASEIQTSDPITVRTYNLATVKTGDMIEANGEVTTGAKPLFRIMNIVCNIAGLFYAPFGPKACNIGPSYRHCHATVAYNVIVQGVLLSTVLRQAVCYTRSIFSKDDEKNATVLKIIMLAWALLCFLNGIACLRASYTRYGHIEAFWKHWMEKVEPSFRELNIQLEFKSFRKTCALKRIIAWSVLIAINVTILLVVLFVPLGSEATIIRKLVLGPFPDHIAIYVLIVILHVYQFCAWIFPVELVVLFTCVLTHTFNVFDRALAEELEGSKQNLSPRFQDFRLLYLELAKAVDILDQDFKWFYAIWYVINIPLACFLSYSLLRCNAVISVVLVIWLIIAAAIVIIPSISAVRVHIAAHAPHEKALAIDTDNMSTQQLCQVQLFLGKLTLSNIGVTVCGLMVVTKDFLLTLAGLFITYFLLVHGFGED